MSKTKENKSGTNIAKKIVKECKKMEEGITESGIEIEKNLKRKFVRNFSSYFSNYFELITGYELKYGNLLDEEFEKLEKDLVKKCKNYSIDVLCKWFKVEKWQDLFPKDYKQVDELKFKKEMCELLIKNFREIVGEDDKHVEEKFLVKEYIFKLMYLDYSNTFLQMEEDEDEEKNALKEILSDDVAEKIDKATVARFQDESKRKHKLKIEEMQYKESEKIRKHIKIITDPQEENKDKELKEIERLRFIGELEPDTLELYDRCEKLYKKNKDVDIDNADEFRKWVDKIRIELNNEKYERSRSEMFWRGL